MILSLSLRWYADAMRLPIAPAVLLRPFMNSPQTQPSGIGTVAFSLAGGNATATVTGSTLPVSAHSYSVLLVDATGAQGHAVPAGYGLTTTVTADASGNLASVALPLMNVSVPAMVRMYLLVDAYPAAVATLAAP
jgi:hypothetical protein